MVCEEGVEGGVGHRNIITKCQKSPRTFGTLNETRGSLNKSSLVKWILDEKQRAGLPGSRGWEGTLLKQGRISVELDLVSINNLELGGGHLDIE